MFSIIKSKKRIEIGSHIFFREESCIVSYIPKVFIEEGKFTRIVDNKLPFMLISIDTGECKLACSSMEILESVILYS